MKAINIFLAAASVLMLGSCTLIRINKNFGSDSAGEITSGQVVEAIKDASIFTINVPAEITYVQTPGEPYLLISASPSIREQIEILQDGNSVTVRPKGKRIKGNVDNLEIRIGTSSLSELNINGSADFSVKGGLIVPEFVLNTNGASDVDIDSLTAEKVSVTVNGAADVDLDAIECGTVSVTVNGAGDINIAGHASKAVLEVNGAGDIDVRKLVADDLVTEIHGIGGIKRQ